MNRKQFLKRLGLLSTTAIAAPAILADNLQSQPATTKITIKSSTYPDPGIGVERMRIYASGNVGMGVLNPKQKFIIRNDT
jgi:hypothetical protein